MSNLKAFLLDPNFDGYFESNEAYYYVVPTTDWEDIEIEKVMKIKQKKKLWEFV